MMLFDVLFQWCIRVEGEYEKSFLFGLHNRVNEHGAKTPHAQPPRELKHQPALLNRHRPFRLK